MSNSASYKAIMDYLVQHASLDNPSSIQEISDATGVSRPTVYRLLENKANAASPDETVSAGIFLAPTTMSVNGGRPARLFYADTKRIVEQRTINLLADARAKRIDLKTPDKYVVYPKHLTPPVVDAIKFERDATFIIMDAQPDTRALLDILFKEDRLEKVEATHKWLREKFEVLKENYDKSLNGEETVKTEDWEKFYKSLELVREMMAKYVLIVDILMQDTQFGKPGLIAADRKIPDISTPIIKEGK